jgi:hypothetical protein
MRESFGPDEGFAFSQYPRNQGEAYMMGYSVRTMRWRYVEWFRELDGMVMGRELYDFQEDPLQRKNHAENPDIQTVVAELSGLLDRAGSRVSQWRLKTLRLKWNNLGECNDSQMRTKSKKTGGVYENEQTYGWDRGFCELYVDGGGSSCQDDFA